MLRKGSWKITNLDGRLDKKNFKLYDLSNDLAEQHDLKEIEKSKFDELISEWDKFADEIKVQVPTPAPK
jgi:arylsulfatase